MSTSQKTDIQQEVTNQIIDLLEQVDLKDYHPPFSNLSALGLPINPVTDKTYQGINVLSLWSHQQQKNFSSNQWATFKQWKSHGSNVKKEEKSSRIIFYKTLIKEEGEGVEKQDIKIPMLKVYNVFNADQVDGYLLKSHPIQDKVDDVKSLKSVDLFCKQTGATIKHQGCQAYYDPLQDYISIPETVHFQNTPLADATENYYSTLLHELTHWTGAKQRLDRKNDTEKTAKENYAFEELVAELGAAFLCAQHQITQTQPEHHAIYIKSWLKTLKNNKAYIFKASAQAAKAMDYLNSHQPNNS